ncbi:MAG TPA: SEC-C metal-binding domain-containing protein, partial [Phycisphaerae bacterium]|nr:SEC-C metal-binding domain-containing protein [Phycisphaerae bacterium]
VQTAHDSIEETLGEFLPEAEEPLEEDEADDEADAGPPPKADYRGLAAWAQAHLGVTVKESDLRQADRAEIEERLRRAVTERIEAMDYSLIEGFLRPDFRLAALADWANKKFDFTLSAADFEGKDGEAAEALLLGHLKTLYAEKERTYPIEFAIEEHLTPQVGQGNQDFDGLATWASRYYLTEVRADTLRHRDPRAVRARLLEIAREFEASDRLGRLMDEGIRTHLPAVRPVGADGRDGPEAWQPRLDRPAASPRGELAEAWRPLAQWAKERLGIEMTGEGFAKAVHASAQAVRDESVEPPTALARQARRGLTAEEVVTEWLRARVRADRRNRMTELERYLLLQVHDTSWKDHLLVMDHLKSSVGLRGYAQQDPLIEFKREGLESFEKMLDAACEKFTDLFFKARWVRQDALARIWAGQSSQHALAASVYEAQRRAALEGSRQSQMAAEGEAVKTIVRTGTKVGRNDPCPCGSGKKYKKCCGRRAS